MYVSSILFCVDFKFSLHSILSHVVPCVKWEVCRRMNEYENLSWGNLHFHGMNINGTMNRGWKLYVDTNKHQARKRSNKF